ncbi:MAG: alpha/beta fold hydrolase [Parasphingorhabdus sp.]
MTFGRIRRWLTGILIALLLVLSGLYAWSYWPISANIDATDPAVTLANKLGGKGQKYREGYIESQGQQIHYISAGEGEPIVFLHGFPSYWFTMFGLMEEFKSDYQVIAIDGLGVGKSDAPSDVDAYKVDKLVGHVENVINELGFEKVHLVGHDWGAALATGYAQTNPSKTHTLTAIGALPHNILLHRLDTDPEYREIFSYMSLFKSANPVLIRLMGVKEQIWTDTYAPFVEKGLITKQQGERLYEDIGQPRRTDRFINWYRANFPEFDDITENDFWPSRHVRITVPALFIYGENDRVVTKDLASDFKNSADAMRVLSLKNTDHRPHFERKDVVVAAIRELIEKQKKP